MAKFKLRYTIMAAVLLAPNLAQATTNNANNNVSLTGGFFSDQHGPYHLRALGVMSAVAAAGFGIFYGVRSYLKSPKRIRSKYHHALMFYQAHKHDEQKSYEQYHNRFDFTHDEIENDISWLNGQNSKDVQELRASLYELVQFVVKKETVYAMSRLEYWYGEHIAAAVAGKEDSLKKLVLGATNARYPYLDFEYDVNNEINAFKRLDASLCRLSDDKKLIQESDDFLQNLIKVRSLVRSLPEYRNELNEREKERAEERRHAEKMWNEQEKQRIEREKLKIEKAKLEKPNNPIVIINNTTTTTQPTAPATNPYVGGYYDKDGYYWP